MSFTLHVQFSGLCLFVVDPKLPQVGVVLPDARNTTGYFKHPDNTKGVAHAAYLRFDLANFDPRFAPAGGELPRNEGVHQFDGEELEFDIKYPSRKALAFTNKSDLARFEDIAPDGSGGSRLMPKPNLFDDALILPDPPVAGAKRDIRVMRSILRGGTLAPEKSNDWYFPNLFKPGKQCHKGDFAGVVRWSCEVEKVTLKIRKFRKADTIDIPLRPVDGDKDVHVKVANLCRSNPMEWPDLELRDPQREDVDFKWLYHLVTPVSERWPAMLLGDVLPVPHTTKGTGQGVEGCVGASIQGSTIG